ncbi:uncharacterized protein F5891DRAFT_1077709, partial [Suillus fuscotomentosus]
MYYAREINCALYCYDAVVSVIGASIWPIMYHASVPLQGFIFPSAMGYGRYYIMISASRIRSTCWLCFGQGYSAHTRRSLFSPTYFLHPPIPTLVLDILDDL